MNQDYLSLLKETFEDVAQLTPEKVRKLVDDTSLFFRDIQAKILSKDPELRKEAEEDALLVKEVIEQQMGKLIENSGMGVEEFTAFAQDPSNLSEQEQQIVAEMHEKFEAVRELPTAKKKKKKKSPKLRLLG